MAKIPTNPTVDQSSLSSQYESDVIHAMLCTLFSKHVRLDMLFVVKTMLDLEGRQGKMGWLHITMVDVN